MASIFARTRERQGLSQDVIALQQFIQAQQQLQAAEGGLAGIRALPLAQRQAFQGQLPQFPAFTPFPQAQSTAGGQLFGDFLLGQQRTTGQLALERAKPTTPTKGIFQQVRDPDTGNIINALVDPATGRIIQKFGAIEAKPATETQAKAREIERLQAIPNRTDAQNRQLARLLGTEKIETVTQIRAEEIRRLQAIPPKQRTSIQQATLTKLLEGTPLVQIGNLPGEFRFLTEDEQVAQAKAQLEKKIAPKPLTPTEQKGVRTTVNTVLTESGITGGVDSKGELIAKALPFGIRGGAAVNQETIGKLWEQTKVETGYSGRNKIQKRQIEVAFDRQIAVLNKGKGIATLSGQYQWNRKQWEATHRRPGETIDDFIKRTGL